MTATSSIDPGLPWAEQIERAEPDLLRSLLKTFVEALMGAEADAICGAPYGTRGPERTNSRNGYRPREWDTRAGTMELAIPKLRAGSYFPDWLLERRKRAERALTSVVATCYLLGVSTRRMERLVETLGITRLSKSQVIVMAKELDEQVESFRTRPLDAGPYTFVAADALVLKVREGGRVVGVHTLLATGVNADGHREILGLDVTSGEDGAGWLGFFRGLVARGLSGVALVTSGTLIHAEPGFAETHGIRQHDLKYRLQLARRAGNDVQHLRGCVLLLQCLGEITRALAQLVEQPGVLDGDDGLRGEIIHQLDLLVGERAHLLAVDRQVPISSLLLEHRHSTTFGSRRARRPRHSLDSLEIGRTP